jgi:hypothetical protein
MKRAPSVASVDCKAHRNRALVLASGDAPSPPFIRDQAAGAMPRSALPRRTARIEMTMGRAIASSHGKRDEVRHALKPAAEVKPKKATTQKSR